MTSGLTAIAYSRDSTSAVCYYRKVVRSHANTVPNAHVHTTYETEKHILRTLDVIQHEPGSDWCYCDGSCYMPIVSNPSLSPRATTPLWFLKCFSLRQLHTHDPVQSVRAHWVSKSGEITHRGRAEGSPGAEDGTLSLIIISRHNTKTTKMPPDPIRTTWVCSPGVYSHT